MYIHKYIPVSHLHHECRGICFYVIITSNAREDLVGHSEASILCRHETAQLGHYLKQCYLLEIGRLSTLHNRSIYMCIYTLITLIHATIFGPVMIKKLVSDEVYYKNRAN